MRSSVIVLAAQTVAQSGVGRGQAQQVWGSPEEAAFKKIEAIVGKYPIAQS
jgi:hypothetical protein